MNNKPTKEVIEQPVHLEEIIENQQDLIEIQPEDIIATEIEAPKMNVAMPQEVENKQLISDEKFTSVLDEVLTNIREDRKQVSDYVDNLADMVINDGDATSSTKEAFVNMVKVKTDLQDKMLKALDLMSRIKSKNTYAYSGPHLNAVQQNNYNIEATELNRKELIRAINKAKKDKK